LLTAMFTHQAAAAVSVRKYSTWEPTATLSSAGAMVGSAARCASAPTWGGEAHGEGRGGAYRGGRPPTACFIMQKISLGYISRTSVKTWIRDKTNTMTLKLSLERSRETKSSEEVRYRVGVYCARGQTNLYLLDR